MDYIAIARKEIESHYDSVCDIIERQSVIENNITKDKKEVTVESEKPCRVSFEDIYANTETDTETKKNQKIKLFIAPELVIKPGSKIVVKGRGRTTTYKNSGEPAIYNTHQEIMLELWKGWA